MPEGSVPTSAPVSAPNTAPVSTPTPTSTPTPEPAAASKSAQAPELFEVKVNGRTVKMTRQEVLDSASMSHAANDKFNEAKKLRSEYEKSQERVKKDFMEYITDPQLGLSKEQIRSRIETWYAKEFIEPETLTKEQREMKELQEWKAKREEADKETEAKSKQEEEEKSTSQHRVQLQQQIIEALDKSNLPKNEETVARMAFFMRQNNLNGWDAPMEMIVRQVQQERQNSFRHEVLNSSVEQVINLLGEEFVNKIRKHDLEQLRKRREAPPVESNLRRPGIELEEGQKVRSSDVNRRLRDMRLGKI